jgi:hypothetical protein
MVLPAAAHRLHPAAEVKHHLAAQVVVGACLGLGYPAAGNPNVRQLR